MFLPRCYIWKLSYERRGVVQDWITGANALEISLKGFYCRCLSRIDLLLVLPGKNFIGGQKANGLRAWSRYSP